MTLALLAGSEGVAAPGTDPARIVRAWAVPGRTKEGTVRLGNMVEPGHELTATPRDADGLCTTVCECGWVSNPGTEAQPFLEARDHILSVRGDDQAR